jgi:hypothetical protein
VISSRLSWVFVALVACAREPAPSPAPPSSASPTGAPMDLDSRIPVPLLPMMAQHQKESMRDHLVAVQEIVAAIATDDFPAVERAAARNGT